MVVSVDPLQFSKLGIGSSYQSAFARAFGSDINRFPFTNRSKTFLMVADFSGQSASQLFETYSFLFLDLEQYSDWFHRQKLFRTNSSIARRRIAFKLLNDSRRREALTSFLSMADNIDGCLVTFAISKNSQKLFREELPSSENDDMLSSWKPKLREHILKIVHLSAYLAAAFSKPNQDFFWLIDEDSAASNDHQVTQLTKVFAHVLSHYLPHNLRHIRCGTSRSDSGSLDLEDLLAIPDLAAGAIAEITTGLLSSDALPKTDQVVPLPDGLSPKSRLIATWLAHLNSTLRRELFLLELDKIQSGSKLTHCKLKYD